MTLALALGLGWSLSAGCAPALVDPDRFGDPDTSTIETDAAAPQRDGGFTNPDAGVRADASGPALDGGPGAPPEDAGIPVPDDAGEDAGIVAAPDAAVPDPPPTAVVTIEAETMTLSGYRLDGGDTIIRINGGTAEASATIAFPGESGTYQLSIDVIAEPDGQPTFTFIIGGTEVASFTTELTEARNEPRTFGPFEVEVQAGDMVEIHGHSERQAWARVDRLVFTP